MMIMIEGMNMIVMLDYYDMIMMVGDDDDDDGDEGEYDNSGV